MTIQNKVYMSTDIHFCFLKTSLDTLGLKLNVKRNLSNIHTRSHREQCPGRTGGWLQMNRLSLRNNRLKFKTAGKLPIILEEFYSMYPNLIKENLRMWTCHRLDLQTLGSQPVVMPIILPHRDEQGEAVDGSRYIGWVWEVHNRLQEKTNRSLQRNL